VSGDDEAAEVIGAWLTRPRTPTVSAAVATPAHLVAFMVLPLVVAIADYRM
jgi:hypothetical protein